MQLKIGYLFQCPPRASPWVDMFANLSPCKGKSFKEPDDYKAFALTGRIADCHYPPGLGASALSGRVSL